jgi:hypothetical protein
MDTASGPPEHEKYSVDVGTPTYQIALCDPQIPLEAKTQVQRNVSRALFMEITPSPPKHEK